MFNLFKKKDNLIEKAPSLKINNDKPALSYEIYRNAARKLIMLGIVLSSINLGFLLYGYYLSFNKHEKTFYVTTTDGDLIKVIPYKSVERA